MHLVPRRCAVNLNWLSTMFPSGIVARASLVAIGMSHSSISLRCRPGGPWQRLIPGVVLLNNGTPTRQQLGEGALSHAGAGAVITGLEAARLHGVRKLPAFRAVHVLIPHERKVASRGFAVVERTIHPPKPVRINGLPVAPLARALVDASRRMDNLDHVRAMIADAVQRGVCEPGALRDELAEASTIGSALPRRVVHEMERGVRSAAEGWAYAVVKRTGLPEPEWNVEITSQDGALLGVADAYWKKIALAWEIDSYDYHLSPEDYRRTMRKHTALAAAGVIVVHTLPSQLRDDPAGVIRSLRDAYLQAAKRPPPNVTSRLWRRAA
jgi:hypothetical protein